MRPMPTGTIDIKEGEGHDIDILYDKDNIPFKDTPYLSDLYPKQIITPISFPKCSRCGETMCRAVATEGDIVILDTGWECYQCDVLGEWAGPGEWERPRESVRSQPMDIVEKGRPGVDYF